MGVDKKRTQRTEGKRVGGEAEGGWRKRGRRETRLGEGGDRGGRNKGNGGEGKRRGETSAVTF